MTTLTSTRHRCSLADRTFHPSGTGGAWRTGKPRSQHCTWCGGAWAVQQGTWTVQVWRGDGRYSLDSAVETARSERAADMRAMILGGDTHCARFITGA